MGNWNYTYDTLNRLTGSANTATTTPGAQYASEVGCWTYDGFGNRTLEAYSNKLTAPCASGANLTLMSLHTVTTPTTAMNNQIAGLSYDGAGNVLADNYNDYVYDAEGRICALYNIASSTATQYVYDAAGTRVVKFQLQPTDYTLPLTAAVCNQVPSTSQIVPANSA